MLSNLRFSFSSFCVFLAFSAQSSWRPIVKTLNLKVWTLPLIFLHDSTLFVIDMHQKRSISLVSTQFYHFHFHPLAGLNCYPHLISCHKESDVALVLLHIWVANHMGYSRRVGRGKTEFYLRRASRRCHDLSTGNMHFWKWSEWVAKCYTNIVCCKGMWELYFECKKQFKRPISLFSLCAEESSLLKRPIFDGNSRNENAFFSMFPTNMT